MKKQKKQNNPTITPESVSAANEAIKKMNLEDKAIKDKLTEEDIRDLLNYFATTTKHDAAIAAVKEIHHALLMVPLNKLMENDQRTITTVRALWKRFNEILTYDLHFSQEDIAYMSNSIEYEYWKEHDPDIKKPERKIIS